MNRQQVRTALEQELGEVRYRRFLEELHGTCEAKKRLLYWQSEVWERFAHLHGISASGFAEVREFFQYCPVHHVELEHDTVSVIQGTRAPGSELQTELEYPYAHDVAYGPCWHEGEERRNVSFCHECRRVKREKA